MGDLYMTKTSDPTLHALASHCPTLRRIDLSTSASDSEGEGYGVWEGTEERLFTDVGITALARGCRKLEWLNVHMCCKLSDKAIIAIAQHCEGLGFLDMSGGDMTFSSEAHEAEKVGRPIPHKYMRFTDASIVTLQAGCPNLYELNIARCPSILNNAKILEGLRVSHPRLEVCTTRGRRKSCLELLSQ